MAKFTKPDENFLRLLAATANLDDIQAAQAAQYQLAEAITDVLREGILSGDTVQGSIYTPMPLAPGETAEWPLDLLSPGQEDDYIAYTNPGNGRIPQRRVEGDYVQIPTYSITNAVDWLLRYAQYTNVPVVTRALQVLEHGFVVKMNNDGWHTVIAAGADRNILVFDGDAAAGMLTKRLISSMKTVMTRNGGGNSASMKRRKLTDMALSPEALEDVRNWNVDQVDEITRREIFIADDNSDKLTRIFSVNLHDLVELGVGQQYQNFFTNQLSGSLQAGDEELVVGLDLTPDTNAFIMPIRQAVKIFPDTNLLREQKEGYFGFAEVGFGSLDSRDVVLGSL